MKDKELVEIVKGKLKEGKAKPSDFLFVIRNEIENLANKQIRKKMILDIINERYGVDISYPTFMKWLNANILKKKKTDKEAEVEVKEKTDKKEPDLSELEDKIKILKD